MAVSIEIVHQRAVNTECFVRPLGKHDRPPRLQTDSFCVRVHELWQKSV